ncbi:unnamed protein product [Sphenostylis stenocarpa]|uniref:Uncharacterized protein n=1 Tax=Sphenostylis stenocarpa TaxID=92480 RepID=A0AA86RX77_9FABA|nr:unnamed protein product [Sphenostylis stenocarpa]
MVWKKEKLIKGSESLENVCGSRLANQSSRKESLRKSKWVCFKANRISLVS